MADQKQVIDNIELAARSVADLCASLSPDDWSKPTDCPGWSVQDQLSHLCGIESNLLGRPAPDHEPRSLDHVKNPQMGRGNEIPVDYRRSWSPEKVLAEFRELMDERMQALRAMSSEEFNKDGFSPTGRGGYAEFMAVRIFDFWMHEQDIRNAVGRPGHLDGPVAAHAMGRCTMAFPMIVGKRVAPPEGSSIVVEITGPLAQTIAIVVEDGRAKAVAEAPAAPTCRVTMDLHALNRLCGGRRTPEQVAGHVTIAGDEAIGRKLLQSMTVTP